jgi:hypothetical protein
MRIFVCKLRLHFPDSKHVRGFIGHEIFVHFFRHSEILGLHPQLYMLATALPPGRQHFRETFFSCPFHFKSAPRNQGPPPPNFLKLLSLSIVLIVDATKIRRIKRVLESLL